MKQAKCNVEKKRLPIEGSAVASSGESKSAVGRSLLGLTGAVASGQTIINRIKKSGKSPTVRARSRAWRCSFPTTMRQQLTSV